MRWPCRSHCRFRFSLRVLLLVFVPLALWLGVRTDQARRQRQVAEWVTQKDGLVCYRSRMAFLPEEPSPLYPYSMTHMRPPLPAYGDEGIWNSIWDLIGPDLSDQLVAVELGLDETQEIPGTMLAQIASLPWLEWLSVSGWKIHPADFAHLQKARQLECLKLTFVDFGDEEIQHLAQLNRLRRLDLSNARISDKGLAALRQCNLPNLEYLDLGGNAITDIGVSALTQCRFPRLQHLDLSKTKITDQALCHLRCFPGLRRLGIARNNITDAGLRDVAQLAGLQELCIDLTKVTGAGLACLEELKELRHLSALYFEESDPGIARLRRAAPKLHVVVDDYY